MTIQHWFWRGTIGLALLFGGVQKATANGGPFVIKYPEGDPAAKGILARIDPDLKPGREERLRVLREDLKVLFAQDPVVRPAARAAEQPPLAVVSAIYTIQNPTDQAIEVDFGFPILRGIYMHPFSMTPSPDAQVTLDSEHIRPEVISNSMIYGLIRQRAGQTIEKAIAADPQLAQLVARARATGYVRQRARETIQRLSQGQDSLLKAVETDSNLSKLASAKSDAEDPDQAKARQDLLYYLTGPQKWDIGPATLLVEYASVELDSSPGAPSVMSAPLYGMPAFYGLGDFGRLAYANLGRLNAIGEQKATQLFAELAARFDPAVRPAYETIFSAWGGDVRERSVDLNTGKVRARELTVNPPSAPGAPGVLAAADPTLYARMDYINPNAGLTPAEKASCEAILKNLPVVFTFAPMNLLHYKAAFPAKTTRTLTVSYKQYAFGDTASPASYQLAYVVHPASFWKEFGPIELEVALPSAATSVSPGQDSAKCSVPLRPAGIEERDISKDLAGFSPEKSKVKLAIYRATVQDKTGELFLGIATDAWKRTLEK